MTSCPVKCRPLDAEIEAVEDVLVARRCPRCQAVAPARAQWCTLCYAALDVAEQGRSTAVELASAGVAPDAHPATSDTPRGGRHARPVAAGTADPGQDASDVPSPQPAGPDSPEAMLALLAAESRGPLSELGGLGARLDSQGARVAVMLGGVVLCTAVFFVLLWLLGHIV